MISIGANPGRRPRWVMRATTAVLVAASLAAVVADVSAAQAVPTTTHRLKVVKVVTRRPFGKMLATTKGRSLYYIPSNRCNKTCLAAWPPLLMPKRSRAIPTGVTCLSTLRFGRSGRQVAYRGHRLYLWVGDHGTTVTGNHKQGFLVAKLRTGGCPLQVVKVVTRRPVGKMLATTGNPGASLYYKPTGTCDLMCQSSWPPFVLAKGSTAVPTGVACLGTASVGQLRQITYRGHLLYTFVGDSGSSASGDRLAGFVAARVQTGRCPR